MIANIMRPQSVSPFSGMGMLEKYFDEMFKEPPVLQRDFNVNVSQKEGSIKLEAELPGVSLDDIEVSAENGLLTISVTEEQVNEDKDATYYLREIRSGSRTRSFRLPDGVSLESINASHKNGILTVQIQDVKSEPERKKIPINCCDN